MGHTILAYSDLDLHTGIVDLAQDFNYTTKSLAITIRVVDDLNTNNLTQFRLTLPFRGDQYVMPNTVIFWRNNEYAIFIEQATNHDFVCM